MGKDKWQSGGAIKITADRTADIVLAGAAVRQIEATFLG
jgi:hypothetical protein